MSESSLVAELKAHADQAEKLKHETPAFATHKLELSNLYIEKCQPLAKRLQAEVFSSDTYRDVRQIAELLPSLLDSETDFHRRQILVGLQRGCESLFAESNSLMVRLLELPKEIAALDLEQIPRGVRFTPADLLEDEIRRTTSGCIDNVDEIKRKLASLLAGATTYLERAGRPPESTVRMEHIDLRPLSNPAHSANPGQQLTEFDPV
jgi:hypothetical protein